MLPDFQMRVASDDSDRKLLADIANYGWHLIHILADDNGPGYSFSVGLYLNFGHPEILVMGLPQPTAQQLINLVVREITNGRVYQPQERVEGLVEGFACSITPILPEYYREYLGYDIWFYRSLKQPFPALQIVWPDKHGRFPWEINFDERFFKVQKLLDRP